VGSEVSLHLLPGEVGGIEPASRGEGARAEERLPVLEEVEAAAVDAQVASQVVASGRGRGADPLPPGDAVGGALPPVDLVGEVARLDKLAEQRRVGLGEPGEV
jgi:hypothetical protein